MAVEPRTAIKVFFSYSHKDQRLRDQLETQLSLMKREGIISSWYDRKIEPGEEWAGKIDAHLKDAQIILLLVSADFLASDYCNDIEVKQAIERHNKGEAWVIPIILRPCDWHNAPFGKLQALPIDGKPVTGRGWHNRDEAFLDIVTGIRKVIEGFTNNLRAKPPAEKPKISSEVNQKINVLIVFVDPQNTHSLRLSTESQAIREAIELSPRRENISVTFRSIQTIHDLRRALLSNEFQIVQISGHSSEEGFVLENREGKEWVIPQAAFADLFQAYSPPLQCIILNTCHSILQGELIAPGIPFTIAMESEISDQTAIEFSRGFYDAIAAGRSVDFAYEEGRRTVQLTVPGDTFAPQLLVKDQALKHFLLQDDSNAPFGFVSIRIDEKMSVALKPSLYRSITDILDDLYINYLNNKFKAYTYGKSWILVEHIRGRDRLVVPWNWLFSENRGKPISSYNEAWEGFVLGINGIDKKFFLSSFLEIQKPSYERIFGIVTNKIGVERIFSAETEKRWYSIFRNLEKDNDSMCVLPESINRDEYKNLFVLRPRRTYHNIYSGRKIYVLTDEYIYKKFRH